MLIRLATALNGLDQRLVYAFTIFVSAAGLLLLWRLWRFTALPAMRPDEPKELPYWVPCTSFLEQDPLPQYILLNDSNHI